MHVRLVVTLAATFLLGACGEESPEALTPAEVGERIGSARLRLAAEDWTGASEVLKELVERAPETPIAWVLLAQSRRREGEYESALEASTTAAGFPQARGGALIQAFLTRVASGDLDQAEVLYRALRIFPMVDFSGLHIGGELEAVRGDERFEALFPDDFDDPFLEPARVVHEWRGLSAGLEFGWEGRNVGDVDGDLVADAVVSAPANQPGGDSSGHVYVYSGRNGDLLWEVAGQPGEQLGMGIEGGGDTNGDDIPDVVVGAPGSSRVYVFSGLDGTVLRTFEAVDGDASGFGGKVAAVGDVSGDGASEIVVGAARANSGAGAAYLFSGANGELLVRYDGGTGEGLGSTVGGAEHQIVIGAPNAGPGGRGEVRVYHDTEADPAFVISAEESGQQLGAMFVSVVGDIDADGVADVYASDWQDGANGPVTGRIYVHSGATGERLLTLVGEGPGEGFGIGPGRAGDVDGDGHDDLVIGAWQHGSAAHSGGKVYVYSGRTGEPLRTLTGRIPGETLGFDADGMGDVDGDGEVDFLLTSAWSLVAGARSGRALVVSGAVPDEKGEDEEDS
ncbi:MAG: hypothetical protein VYE73_18995 [Acidobacteriota bacterium]|nr:hypothetical protein [Acidobacteriota bacterium]